MRREDVAVIVIVPPSVSLEPHAATKLPARSVAIAGSLSLPISVVAFVFNAAGSVHVAPSSAL